MTSSSNWRIGVDTGGTFTDGILWNAETGESRTAKVLSTPEDPGDAFLAVVRRLLTEAQVDVPEVDYVVHGTTVATNAVLEGTLARVGFVTTEGFRDLFEIARQVRANPYDVFAEKPAPAVPRERCFEVAERVYADGSVARPLEEQTVSTVARALKNARVEAVAVCLLHSYANRAHERRVGEIIAAALPNVPISLSCEVAPEFREFPRACTAAINAGLTPVVAGYLAHIEEALASEGIAAELRVMQSNGGVLPFALARERPIYLLESGPAAGVLGAAYLGRRIGTRDLISFDMGGTTAKVGLVRGGEPRMVSQFEIGKDVNQAREWFTGATGYPILTPAVDLVEVGAGGGSIAWVDSGGKLRVGPRSAGADPGPACYGRGGTEPTLTDANLLLGRLNPNFFLGGELDLDPVAAGEAIGRVAAHIELDPVEAALGIVELADAAMARAIHVVSVQRGYDPRSFALVAFGGAGPLHAAALADRMEIPRVVVQPGPGLASALGLLVTDVKHEFALTRLHRLDDVDPAALGTAFAELAERGRSALAADGVAADEMLFLPRLEMRYVGQSYQLVVPFPSDPADPGALDTVATAFHAAHAAAYGYSDPEEPTELVNLRLTAVGAVRKPERVGARSDGATGAETARAVCFRPHGFVETRIHDRRGLRAGFEFDGPAIVEEEDSTTVVPPSWRGRVDGDGNLVLERIHAANPTVPRVADRVLQPLEL